jgi:ATP-dependent DNA helicase RecG
VDEQHRFGVRQRAALRRAGGWIPDEKTGMVPHLLVLSATPIPRSLALTAYGDLELTTLDESPPGRRVVATNLGVGQTARREAWAAVKAAVAAGGQGFVVCPAIVEQKPGRRASVLSRFRELGPLLAPARVGLLHGQMPSAEQLRWWRLSVPARSTFWSPRPCWRWAWMCRALRSSSSRMPSASAWRSCTSCAAVWDGQGRRRTATCSAARRIPRSLDRLAFVAATSSGFSIAEEDLRRRGPGEIYGEQQTGVVSLWMRDPAGVVALVERARQEAEALLGKDPELASSEHVALRQAVEARWLRRRPIAEEAG